MYKSMSDLTLNGKWSPIEYQKNETDPLKIHSLVRTINGRSFSLKLPVGNRNRSKLLPCNMMVICSLNPSISLDETMELRTHNIPKSLDFMAQFCPKVEILRTTTVALADRILEILFGNEQSLVAPYKDGEEAPEGLPANDLVEDMERNALASTISAIPGWEKKTPFFYLIRAKPIWLANPDAYLFDLTVEYDSGDDKRNFTALWLFAGIKQKYFTPIGIDTADEIPFVTAALAKLADPLTPPIVKKFINIFLLPCPDANGLAKIRDAIGSEVTNTINNA